jgi:hypothetical protein
VLLCRLIRAVLFNMEANMRYQLRGQNALHAGTTGRSWLAKPGRGGDVSNHAVGCLNDVGEDRRKVLTSQHHENYRALRSSFHNKTETTNCQNTGNYTKTKGKS